MKSSILLKFYLPENFSREVVGAFIEDYITDKKVSKFPEDINHGARIQRELNEYFYNHAVFKECEVLLGVGLVKNSRKIIPVFFDHILSREWEANSTKRYTDFVKEIQLFILSSEEAMPYKYARYGKYMIKGHWLDHLNTLSGLHSIMLERTRLFNFNSNMHLSLSCLIENYEAFKNLFYAVLPDLKAKANELYAGEAKEILVVS